MEEESWRRDHEGGIIEGESWRKTSRVGIVEEGSWREGSRRHPRASEGRLRGIWGRLEEDPGEWEAQGGVREAPEGRRRGV